MASTRAPLPERPRRYRFALTPLADAMFQLLIFFMLSTSLTPYSLLTLKTATAPASEDEAPAGAATDPASTEAPAPQTPPDRTLWTILNGTVRSAGVDYALDQLGPLADAIGSQDRPGDVVLIVTDEARVQDVAVAMEALQSANVAGVQIARDGG